jgi:hypothetical protein
MSKFQALLQCGSGSYQWIGYLLSMVSVAKASQARVRFLIDTESNSTFCYVKGLQLE